MTDFDARARGIVQSVNVANGRRVAPDAPALVRSIAGALRATDEAAERRGYEAGLEAAWNLMTPRALAQTPERLWVAEKAREIRALKSKNGGE